MFEHLEKIKLGTISPDKYSPTGNINVGYPQLSIRTDRTAERTKLDFIIEIANRAANQFPEGDKRRATAVIKTLNSALGSGNFGHSWIIIFNSSELGDCNTYGYHEGFGYVKNKDDDSPEQKFHLEYTVKLDNPEEKQHKMELELIPILNIISAAVGMVMGNEKFNPETGAYTPINNCTWFTGNLWKWLIGYPLKSPFTYEQVFNGADHADNWVMPYLSMVNKIADPGMLAETLNKIELQV